MKIRTLSALLALATGLSAWAAEPPRTPPTGETWDLATVAASNRPGEIRVALVTDSERVLLGGSGDHLRLQTTAGDYVLLAPLELRPGRGAGAAEWAIQSGAFTDRLRAEEHLREVTASTGLTATIGAASASSTYPVYLGSYPNRNAARAAATSHGLSGAFPVARRRVAGNIEIRDARGDLWRVKATEFDLESTTDVFRQGGHRWRGRARISAGTSGKLHLIDVVDLEDYLRGVVPAEMGPKMFPSLEALKAQAVAARTYALRHRGESASEGYDVCATPRCQAYKGRDAEDPLSDQAVRETAGLVLTWQGDLADTLFTSTCGGRTEEIGAVFPGRTEPYLKSVSCAVEGAVVPPILGLPGPDGDLAGARAGAFRRWLANVGIEAGDLIDREFVLAASNQVRRALAAPLLPGRPVSADRGVLIPALLEAFRLSPAASDLDRSEDRSRLAASAGDDLRYARSIALLSRFDWDEAELDLPASEPLSRDDWFRLAGRLAEETGILERVEGIVLPESMGGWMLRLENGSEWVPSNLGGRPLLWQSRHGRYRGSNHVEVQSLDRIEAWVDGPKLLGIAVRSEPANADRESPHSTWTRRISRSDLVASIKRRRPLRHLSGFDVLDRGASGRVTRLRVIAEPMPFVLEGLDVRFTLELPESLFSVTAAAPRAGEPTWLFLGRGWGHGVGLCQWGSWGLASAGWDFRHILAHYYPGTALGRLGGP